MEFKVGKSFKCAIWSPNREFPPIGEKALTVDPALGLSNSARGYIHVPTLHNYFITLISILKEEGHLKSGRYLNVTSLLKLSVSQMALQTPQAAAMT